MCIVIKDFSQISKEDFMDIFSFVTKFFTLWIFLAYVTYLYWDLYYVDVVTAYLHGSFDKKIYITIPDGIEHSESSHYSKLKRALYRLKQAKRQWKKHLHEVLIKFGFTYIFADNCLYIKHHEGKIILLILVYIDNMTIAGPNRYHIISFKLFLNEGFKITDLDELKYMLGVLVIKDCSKHLIYLN